MNAYWTGEDVDVYHGDCLDVLRTMADNSIDAIVTDPPYELSFMSKRWDATGVAFNPAIWAECLRVLKPGGHMLSFGGDRTHHRMMVAIEDAGFEIRQPIFWLFGSGMPKSLDVSKAIDKAAGANREVVGVNDDYLRRKPNGMKTAGATAYGYSETDYPTNADITAPATDAARQWQGWGTGLKPAAEIICCARKPLTGTVAQCVTTWGTGALNIDGCRIGTGGQLKWDTPRDMGYHGGTDSDSAATANPAGRWPANVILDESQAAALDKMSGVTVSNVRMNNGRSHVRDDSYTPDRGGGGDRGHTDQGGQSRYFKVFPTFRYCAKAPGTERPSQDGVQHATVKPLDLMQYLVRLVTPPGGTVLDPFAGSGTTGEAAIREGFKTILIEQEADYLPLILERFRRPINYIMDFGDGEPA